MKRLRVYQCPTCHTPSYARAEQQTRACPRCGTRVKLQHQHSRIVHSTDEARALVQQWKLAQSGTLMEGLS